MEEQLPVDVRVLDVTDDQVQKDISDEFQCLTNVDTDARTYGVKIKPSAIPDAGDGLFVLTEKKKHELLPYWGKIYRLSEVEQDGLISEDLKDRMLATAIAPVDFPDDQYVIVAGFRCSASYANHSNDPTVINAEFYTDRKWTGLDKHKPPTYLRFLRAIRPGEEIFVNYGDSFWEGREEPEVAPNLNENNSDSDDNVPLAKYFKSTLLLILCFNFHDFLPLCEGNNTKKKQVDNQRQRRTSVRATAKGASKRGKKQQWRPREDAESTSSDEVSSDQGSAEASSASDALSSGGTACRGTFHVLSYLYINAHLILFVR